MAANTNHPSLWLPYAQMQTALPPLEVVRTQGSEIHLADGRTLIDGIASWWTACHGYSHPTLVAAAQTQAATLSHVMLGGLVHQPALTLAERLKAVSPSGLNHVFFTDSGSVAVEVAIKMATQFWRNQGHASRHKIICFKNGYHGDTTGAMSVSDPEQNFHIAFQGVLPQQLCVDVPQDEQGFEAFEALVKTHANEVAALIIEPLVQGAGGMKFHTPATLKRIHDICKKHHVIFVADEVATGFGRTGTMFACEQAGITPDIMCLGKAITGGMMTLAATLASTEIFEGFLADDESKAFMHGPTYMGNALACAIANASLDVFEAEGTLAKASAMQTTLESLLAPAAQMAAVADVRCLGAIGVVELKSGLMDRHALRAKFIAKGLWIRPLEDVIYLTPAFNIPPAQLDSLCTGILEVVAELS